MPLYPTYNSYNLGQVIREHEEILRQRREEQRGQESEARIRYMQDLYESHSRHIDVDAYNRVTSQLQEQTVAFRSRHHDSFYSSVPTVPPPQYPTFQQNQEENNTTMSPRTTSTVHCKICNTVVTDAHLKYQYYQEDYPDILIGPYCPDCFKNIRICCGCQKPHIKDQTIKYYKKGLWYCEECAASLTTCTVCNSIVHTVQDIDGEKVCPNCLQDKYFYCNYCNSYHKTEKNVYHSRPVLRSSSDTRVEDWELKKAQYPKVYEKYQGKLCAIGFQKETAGIAPIDITRCQYCGELHAVSNMETTEYCKECYKGFKKCSDCGKKHPTVVTIKIDGKSTILCKSCQSRVNKCVLCGRYTKKTHIIKGDISTYKVCHSCKESYPQLHECSVCFSLTTDVVDGKCGDCRTTYINNKCSHCGAVKDFTEECRKCGSRQTSIYPYSTKPRLYFNRLKGEGKDLYFGIENEMTFESEITRDSELKELYKNFDPTVLLVKSDGSISGPGYELVTQPMTLGFFNQLNVAAWFGSAVRSSSCGMHVHLGRTCFESEVHLYKFINFIHNNEKFCDKVAGRGYTNYNTRLENKPSRAVKKGSSSRYCRVNTSGEHTIEIRMFAGCINEFEMRCRVEFLHALWDFCKGSAISAITKEKFTEFVQNNNKLYYNLSKFLIGV